MALPRMVNDKKLKNIQWHLQEQRQRLHENVLLRKSMLEANYAREVQVEKDEKRKEETNGGGRETRGASGGGASGVCRRTCGAYSRCACGASNAQTQNRTDQKAPQGRRRHSFHRRS